MSPATDPLGAISGPCEEGTVVRSPVGVFLPGRKALTAFAVCAWLAIALAGTWAMAAYANRSGDGGSPPASWPAESRLPHPTALPVLVVFVHPHCPCSRASLGELDLLMTHCAGRLEARAIFVAPAGQGPDWTSTGLWQTAREIPGVVIGTDAGGHEARLFRTATSGDVLLYDPAGRLIFHGGITLARGHSGDNPGRSAIEAILHGEGAPAAATPVFGCGLFSSNSRGTPRTR
jgi:hypothetical protein